MISLNTLASSYRLQGNSILNNDNNGNGFGKMLENSIANIDSYQKNFENKMVSFIKGDEKEIHNVMIAMQEAKLSMQLAIEIRNKMVDAYQELSRIQI